MKALSQVRQGVRSVPVSSTASLHPFLGNKNKKGSNSLQSSDSRGRYSGFASFDGLIANGTLACQDLAFLFMVRMRKLIVIDYWTWRTTLR